MTRSLKIAFFILLFAPACFSLFSSQSSPALADSETYSTTITWITDKPSSSQVEYGLDAFYGSKTMEESALAIDHEVILNNLQPSTLYHYRVISKDALGKATISPDYVFVTPHESLSQEPPQISGVQAVRMVASRSQDSSTELSQNRRRELRDGVSEQFSAKEVLHEMVASLSDDEAGAVVAGGAVLHKGGAESQKPVTPAASAAAEAEGTAAEAEAETEAEVDAADESVVAGQLVKQEPAIEETLIKKGGLLLPKGTWQYEPSLTYAHLSANNISIQGITILPVLVIGSIDSQKVKRDITIANQTLRYGLLDNWQVDVRGPYKFQYERVSTGDTSDITASQPAGAMWRPASFTTGCMNRAGGRISCWAFQLNPIPVKTLMRMKSAWEPATRRPRQAWFG